MSEEGKPLEPENVRVVRAGHGANCSSIGSVVDTLFVTALAGGAIFAAIAAALSEERARAPGAARDARETASPEEEPGDGAP